MTDLEFVTQHFDALKQCTASDVHVHLSPALQRFRFIPRAERRACADALAQWTREHATDAPLKGACAVLVQSMDRFIDEEHQASLQLLTQARTVFAECNDRDGLGMCAMLIGAIYRTFGNYDLALKILWEGHELLKASGRYPVFLAANANSIANIDLDLGHFEEARAMFHVTYEQSTLGDDFYFKTYALHGLGRVYMHMDKRGKAEEMFQQALDLAEQHQHPLHISNSLTEFATLHFRSGNLDAAESLSARALAIREEHHLLGGAVTNCIRLAEIHARRGEWTKALPLLTRTLSIAEELKVKPKMAQVHQLLSELYERTHDPERSLVHFKRFHELREQVAREDSARKAADAKLIFEAERIRNENVIIKEQKAEIQRQNRELHDTIDALTRARIGRKARAMTLGLVMVLFVFQDLILGTALRWLASDSYFLSLGVKMAIIFSLAPINRAIERHLLKRVARTVVVVLSAGVLAHAASAQDILPRAGVDTATVRPRTDDQRAAVSAFTKMKAQTDAFRGGKREPRLFARLGQGRKDCPERSDSIVPVTNPGKWPKIHTDRFTVWTDTAGRVIAATESPFSCSGDWSINFTYYFDTGGRTAGFERFSGFFYGCSFGPARETTSYVFDAAGALMSKQYAITDAPGKAQRAGDCTFHYHLDYSIYASWPAYAAANGLPERP